MTNNRGVSIQILKGMTREVANFEWPPEVPLYYSVDSSLVAQATHAGDVYAYVLPLDLEMRAQRGELHVRPTYIEVISGDPTPKLRLKSLHLTEM